jgi:uncharacterized membrane protein
MRARLFGLMYDLRASYWFVPSVMALLGILLGGVMVYLDAGPGAGLLDGLGWYQKAKPDGAHQVLSTIAGSMITVAGVVFSITIVAIAYAASQYGPRILTNFMTDRGNQVTLGTFIATFVYCLVVLRTIRGGDEGEFVPQMAVMVGLFLALCSIAVLIFFIHHVPRSIHINNVAARIGKQLLRSLNDRFPIEIGEPRDEVEASQAASSAAELALDEGNSVGIISACDNGYIQAVDGETLMEIARSHDLTMRLHHIPGNFVIVGEMLVSIWPASKFNDEIGRKVRSAYSIGSSRTPAQDMFFLVDELVEIAARALSPGVNDPFTAITCIDWLAAAAVELTRRRIPSPCRVDENGMIRVIAVPQSYAGFLERSFGRMRQYVAGDVNASIHAFDSLTIIGVQCRSSDLKRSLAAEAAKLLLLAEYKLQGPLLDEVRRRHDEAVASWTS